MLIVCPNCSRSYLVRAATLGQAGRLVRCSVCRTAWRTDSGADEQTETLTDQARPDVQNEPDVINPAPILERRSFRKSVAFGAAAAALASFTVMVGSDKTDGIVLRAIGWMDAVIPSNELAGLSFAHITTKVGSEGGETTLLIEGEIQSDSDRRKSLPPIQFTMRDGTENTIFQWMIPAPATTIVKGEPIPFKARLASPPRDGKDIRIRFSDV